MYIEIIFMVAMLILEIILLTTYNSNSTLIVVVENLRLFTAQIFISVGYIVVYRRLNNSFCNLIPINIVSLK